MELDSDKLKILEISDKSTSVPLDNQRVSAGFAIHRGKILQGVKAVNLRLWLDPHHLLQSVGAWAGDFCDDYRPAARSLLAACRNAVCSIREETFDVSHSDVVCFEF